MNEQSSKNTDWKDDWLFWSFIKVKHDILIEWMNEKTGPTNSEGELSREFLFYSNRRNRELGQHFI